MTISKEIKDKAEAILKENCVLPCGIKVGEADPVYFVAEVNDLSVYTHTTFTYEKKIYKIGTKK